VRLRFYGEAIPEPATGLILLFGALVHLATRLRVGNTGRR
jgi:hypothetical protein